MDVSLFELQLLVRILLAMLFGGIIGLERELHGRPAGFRTHLLVSLGAALFMGISLHFYEVYGGLSGTSTVRIDPSRVAAQIVVGIGFLGAGAIIRDNANVRGLTTAACLWVAAAVGMACGAGMLLVAFVVTMSALVSLMMLKQVESRLNRDRYRNVLVEAAYSDHLREQIRDVVAGCGSEMIDTGIDRDIANQLCHIEFQVKVATGSPACDLISKLSLVPGVTRVKLQG